MTGMAPSATEVSGSGTEDAGGRCRVIVRGPWEGRRIALGDAAEVVLKAVGAETGGTLSAYECVVPPATGGPPLHLHRGWERRSPSSRGR
ncbi:MAG: hypothetical protein AVDCRST_MAG59-2113 [uncultured Thermomicrobiales bacterium]|uniref:Uncharacterized protein n=1 Tax=uncultured Thermomicrobiales bacterium TaxID=1645740 RepID=A0A6J4UN13_9BACT|nr:MAG: hypothetical protein AVDCRST_MAG59-2113 [uncultured Thermomicrobiales bacterium]